MNLYLRPLVTVASLALIELLRCALDESVMSWCSRSQRNVLAWCTMYMYLEYASTCSRFNKLYYWEDLSPKKGC